MTKKQIRAFQNEILDWYGVHKRDLPWRRIPYDTRLQQRDPYKILVSEVMLQQTQVQRVIPKYENWLKVFPTLENLAKASTRDVLLHWSGLGYNRRALFLQKLAQELVHSYSFIVHGKKKIVWPRTEEKLRLLPGIGEYTARALLCFAFDQQIAVVDTNVKKVILTQFSISNSQFSNKDVKQIADQLLPKDRAYEWNQALMDYASAMLKEHKIPIPKQSKFKGSDRYYRGLTLRILLKEHTMGFNDLLEVIRKDHPIVKERYQKILLQLEKDGLIRRKRDTVMLPR